MNDTPFRKSPEPRPGSLGWQLAIISQAGIPSGSPLKGPPPKGSPMYSAAYKAWKDTWQPVLSSVGSCAHLASDAFTRQSARVTLFYDGICAALCLCNFADMREDHHRDDSYFAVWPEEAIHGLTRLGPSVLVANAFTVTREFRKNVQSVSTKDLLMGVLTRYFQESSFDSMTGNMRNTKGMNDLAYHWGAVPLMKDVLVHDEPSDLVGFFKDEVRKASFNEFKDLIDRLWRERVIDLGSEDFKQAA